MRYLSQPHNGDSSSRQNTREYINQSIIQGKIYDNLITIGDINCALRGSKINTPGQVGVKYSHIKQLSDAEMLCLVGILLRVLRLARDQDINYTAF